MSELIHVIIGPPCAGKSTYINEHKKDGDLVIDYDVIASALGSPKKHDAEGLIKKAAFEAREGAIKEALKSPGSESWIIHTKPSTQQLENYEKAEAEIIKLDPGRDVCLERARQDERPQCTFDGINRWYDEQKGNNMAHLFKTFELKAADNGTIEGYFSTYDKTPDSYGDIIEPGAFTKTIEKREASGHPFPLCFNHDFSAVIGAVDSVTDTEKGPFIKAHFLDTALAQDVRKMLMSGAIYQFSFAYDILGAREPDDEEKKAGVANVLTDLEVFEISVVTVPANQNAVATEVKAIEPETKSGRRNSKKDADIIKQIRDLAQSLLDDEGEDTPEKTEADTEKVDRDDNEASKDQSGLDNSKRADALLEKIKNMEV